MWKNYLVTAWRGLMRNRMFSIVNISGLALAISACLLIGLFILYERNYDRQGPHAEHIWRAYNETITDGKVVTQDANTHAILGPSLKNDLPEVVEFTRLYNRNQPEVNIVHQNQPLQIKNAWMTDPAFLRMFPQQFISGDPKTCLTNPYSIVITASTAEKLFNRINVVGEVMHIPGGWLQGDYTITAVVEDPPSNTHLKFSLLASYSTREAKGTVAAWDSYWDYNYFQLTPGADVKKVKNQLAIYSEKYLKSEGIRLNMQPLTDIHLHSKLTYEIEPNSDASTIKALGFIAIFILFIAFINYINLTTSTSIVRAKEVGVRKVLGADRKQLIKQFLTEGGLISAVAILLALVLLWLSLPEFEKFLGKELTNYPGFNESFWLIIPAVWLLSILCACFYPAFALSSFSPIKTLRNNLSIGGKNSLRRVLVVFQFACSTVLIIGIFVILQQLQFMRNHDKGLSLDQVIAIKIPEPDWSRDSLNQQSMELFRQKLHQLPEVKSVATSSIVPGQGITTIAGTSGGLFWTSNPAVVAPATIYFYHTDPSFFSAYSIRFLSGAPFQATSRREANAHVVINDAARKLFGFPDALTAVGQNLAYRDNQEFKMTIHGVVADFHIESAKEPVRPTLYHCTPPLTSGFISVKADVHNPQSLLHKMNDAWRDVYPQSVFDYSFVNEAFQRQFKTEEQLAFIVSGFTLFAVFIACIGLFGLAFITTGQRKKEIGVRKVLGATVTNLVALLSKDYLKLVLIAIVIAIPVAAVVMNNWLQDFAYRIQIEWWVFVIAGFAATAISLLTVTLQTFKAARVNPVNNLRTE